MDGAREGACEREEVEAMEIVLRSVRNCGVREEDRSVQRSRRYARAASTFAFCSAVRRIPCSRPQTRPVTLLSSI